MRFEMNSSLWTIIEKDEKTLKEIYEANTNEEILFIRGLTRFNKQIIMINKNMTIAQKRITLIHELTHCYIKSFIHYDDDLFNEEEACDLVANSHDIITKIVDKYTELMYEREEDLKNDEIYS